jgi:hypothetical protein
LGGLLKSYHRKAAWHSSARSRSGDGARRGA